MRKYVLLLFIFIFSICGCSKSVKVKPETANLSFTIDTVYNNTQYNFTALTDENSNLNFTVNQPEVLANFKILFSKDNVLLNYLDLEKEIPLDNLEEDSILRIIYEGILKTSKTEHLEYEDQQYFLQFKVNQNNYLLFFGESGLPLQIKSENNSTTIDFKGITISD